MTLIEECRVAMRDHLLEAETAYSLYKSHCENRVPIRVPGMDTIIRLARRIYLGSTPERAAASEYLYRWNLALRSPIFGAPHSLGM